MPDVRRQFLGKISLEPVYAFCVDSALRSLEPEHSLYLMPDREHEEDREAEQDRKREEEAQPRAGFLTLAS
jgi:hypothetical protein